MITIFSIPKPFTGHIAIIQRNAIKSWIMLSTSPEIILLGDEQGVVNTCNELGLVNISELETNEHNTPYLSDAFEKAQSLASNDTVCYVNTDIIFTDRLISSIKAVRKWNNKYLIIGRRSNLEIDNEIDFQNPDWQKNLEKTVKKIENLATPYFIDYFTFPKCLFNEIPPFLVGRAFWDNWFIWNAIDKGIPVVDVSAVNTAIHQNHDYSHHPEGKKGAYEGKEAAHNSELLGGRTHYYSISDANYILTSVGIKRNLTKEYFRSKYQLLFWIFMTKTRNLRHKIGITGSSIKRLTNILHKLRGNQSN